ncbi:BZ3500_MvSof-1268-A1-R1_Chr2-2g05079 [Microbotryum saponariae]|uniref:BZ3500_MvSof-1268-A1-R1_Chr2-2g05079 protein n=1 Tax=Microbotryum saponariae TaxID=289078 RepID=A0A2X0KX20_9BASI|nr:BZ3500_MvSof-1268-A1-R1_Chr2-2g05079 [Microbotryum saponariae]SDA00860.1 BZ3501_MvSof-1269-A2-R1_Chr2-2g04753 [Microbotryum saponariae]
MPSASSFVLSGIARDGYTTSTASTATCFCGAVQLEFPLEAPGLVSSFVCHCYDCRKITASMFAFNFIVLNSHLKHLRGGANLSSWGQAATIESGNRMTNYFCKMCGTLMYRVSEGFPGSKILRIGTVDDFSLHETILKPSMEQYVKDRVGWLKPAEGMRQIHGSRWQVKPRGGNL